MTTTLRRAQHKLSSGGFTLIELMVVVAIIAIIATIAIPAYQSYVTEARYGVLRSNIDSLRVFLEDYRLDENIYVNGQWTADGTVTTLDTIYGWQPDGDGNKTNYTVTATMGGNSFDILAQDTLDNTTWIRCQDRMTNCCYPDTPAATPAACP